MIKVDVKEKFNTSFGIMIMVKNDIKYSVGDILDTEYGMCKIKQIKFPTRPMEDNVVSLLVDFINERGMI